MTPSEYEPLFFELLSYPTFNTYRQVATFCNRQDVQTWHVWSLALHSGVVSGDEDDTREKEDFDNKM